MKIQNVAIFLVLFLLLSWAGFSDFGVEITLRHHDEWYLYFVRVMACVGVPYGLFDLSTSAIRVDNEGVARVRAFFQNTWKMKRFIAWDNVLKVCYSNSADRKFGIFILPKNSISSRPSANFIKLPLNGFDSQAIIKSLWERGVSIDPAILADYQLEQKVDYVLPPSRYSEVSEKPPTSDLPYWVFGFLVILALVGLIVYAWINDKDGMMFFGVLAIFFTSLYMLSAKLKMQLRGGGILSIRGLPSQVVCVIGAGIICLGIKDSPELTEAGIFVFCFGFFLSLLLSFLRSRS